MVLSFFYVENEMRLASKLDNIFLEEMKIQVNLPRFSRRKNEVRSGEVKKHEALFNKEGK